MSERKSNLGSGKSLFSKRVASTRKLPSLGLKPKRGLGLSKIKKPDKKSIYATARALTLEMHSAATKTGADWKGFAIKGSAAMMMHGAPVKPGDVDMVTHSIPQANLATKRLGYKRLKGIGGMKTMASSKPHMPEIDVMHSGEFGDKVKDTRLIRGVRVKSRKALMKDLAHDKRPEKAKRNFMLLSFFNHQIKREKNMQIVPYRGL